MFFFLYLSRSKGQPSTPLWSFYRTHPSMALTFLPLVVLSPSFPRLGSPVWLPMFINFFFPTTGCCPSLGGWTMFLPSTSPLMSLFLELLSILSEFSTPTPPTPLTTGSTPSHLMSFSRISGSPSWFWGTSTSTTPSQTLYGTSHIGRSRPRPPISRKRLNLVSPSLTPQVSIQGCPWWAKLALRS